MPWLSGHGTENQRVLLHELLVRNSILLRVWCQGDPQRLLSLIYS